MEGSAEEIGAPESWEMVDLEESMTRMRLLSSKKPSVPSSPSPHLEYFPEESTSASSSSSSSSSSLSLALGGTICRRIPEEALNQVDQFLREALEKPRERLSILRMEQDVEKFLRNPTQQLLEFQALPTSYLRLAAHRIAQHYYLQSLVLPDNSLSDGSGSRIVLRKTFESHFPEVRLADIPVNLLQEDVNAVVKVAIKQRPQKGSQNTSNSNAHSSRIGHPKTVEERKEDYNKARARIFSSSSSDGIVMSPESDSTFDDSFQYCPIMTQRSDQEFVLEGHGNDFVRGLNGSSGSSRPNRNKIEKEPVASRYRPNNRVAIFRDRDVERKDPDFDRSYDRYMQRFDPGFGFNGGTYTVQPLFSPTVNYNTEFPQLGSGHRPIEHQPLPIPQHPCGPWPGTSTPSAIAYGPPEPMMPPFNVNRVGSHPSSSVYMHSSQYSVPMRPGMSFLLPHDYVQPFAQTHQQQSDASFGLARRG